MSPSNRTGVNARGAKRSWETVKKIVSERWRWLVIVAIGPGQKAIVVGGIGIGTAALCRRSTVAITVYTATDDAVAAMLTAAIGGA